MKNANEHFGNSMGTNDYYRHTSLRVLYTDGVKDLATNCQAYWLIDLIASHQTNKAVRSQLFQVWVLKRVKESCFDIQATDGNDNSVASQQIPFSDFPFDEATIWLVDGCLMLPCEY